MSMIGKVLIPPGEDGMGQLTCRGVTRIVYFEPARWSTWAVNVDDYIRVVEGRRQWIALAPYRTNLV